MVENDQRGGAGRRRGGYLVVYNFKRIDMRSVHSMSFSTGLDSLDSLRTRPRGRKVLQSTVINYSAAQDASHNNYNSGKHVAERSRKHVAAARR